MFIVYHFGELNFTCESSLELFAKIKQVINKFTPNLMLSIAENGIKYSGEDKYVGGLTKQINTLIHEVKKKFPDFGLEGEIEMPNENGGDLAAYIIIEDGIAVLYEKDRAIYTKAEDES